MLCLGNYWSVVPCGSRPSVAGRSFAIYVNPFVFVDEMTLDESSWRSDMWWRYAQSSDCACFLSERPMFFAGEERGQLVFFLLYGIVRDIFSKKHYSFKKSPYHLSLPRTLCPQPVEPGEGTGSASEKWD
jgi:hypothetical protein